MKAIRRLTYLVFYFTLQIETERDCLSAANSKRINVLRPLPTSSPLPPTQFSMFFVAKIYYKFSSVTWISRFFFGLISKRFKWILWPGFLTQYHFSVSLILMIFPVISLNRLDTIKLYTLNEWIAWHMNYIWIKLCYFLTTAFPFIITLVDWFLLGDFLRLFSPSFPPL